MFLKMGKVWFRWGLFELSTTTIGAVLVGIVFIGIASVKESHRLKCIGNLVYQLAELISCELATYIGFEDKPLALALTQLHGLLQFHPCSSPSLTVFSDPSLMLRILCCQNFYSVRD